MSGIPSCAFTAPSSNCTMEWMTDCGCTTTSIWSGRTPNSHLASITSNPLFIMEAESIVILAPMSQLGCFSACALVTVVSCSIVQVRNGPPEAVSITFSIWLPISPARHWKTAECSESTGRMGTPLKRARSLMSSPATTSVSLLARAIGLRARMAFMVGFSPAYPTMAVNTISMGFSVTIWQRASAPAYTLIGRSASASFSCVYFDSLAITTASGLNLRAWAMSSSTRLLAVNTYASYWSGCSSMTCNACVPMEPVEPSMAICFIYYYAIYSLLFGD